METEKKPVQVSVLLPPEIAAIVEGLMVSKRINRTAALIEIISSAGQRQDPAAQIAALRRELLSQSEVILEIAAVIGSMAVDTGRNPALVSAAIEELRSDAGFAPGQISNIKKIQAIAARLKE